METKECVMTVRRMSHCSLRSTLSQPMSLISILILSSYHHLGLPSCLLSSCFPCTHFSSLPHISHIHYPSTVITTFDKQYKSCSSSLRSLLQSPVNSSLLGPNLPNFITYCKYFSPFWLQNLEENETNYIHKCNNSYYSGSYCNPIHYHLQYFLLPCQYFHLGLKNLDHLSGCFIFIFCGSQIILQHWHLTRKLKQSTRFLFHIVRFVFYNMQEADEAMEVKQLMCTLQKSGTKN